MIQLKPRSRLTLLIYLVYCFVSVPMVYAAESRSGAIRDEMVIPKEVPIKGGNEFYSTNPNHKVLVPINIWGEVNSPGIHYLPVGASVSGALGAAGGPGNSASLPDVELRRGNDIRSVDVYENGAKTLLMSNDTVIVKASVKKDLPLILSSIGTALSIISLTVLLRR